MGNSGCNVCPGSSRRLSYSVIDSDDEACLAHVCNTIKSNPLNLKEDVLDGLLPGRLLVQGEDEQDEQLYLNRPAVTRLSVSGELSENTRRRNSEVQEIPSIEESPRSRSQTPVNNELIEARIDISNIDERLLRMVQTSNEYQPPVMNIRDNSIELHENFQAPYGNRNEQCSDSTVKFHGFLGQFGFEDDASDDNGVFHNDEPRVRRRSITSLNKMRDTQKSLMQQANDRENEQVF